MNRRERRRNRILIAKGLTPRRGPGPHTPQDKAVRIKLGSPGRKALLLGTRRELLLGTVIVSAVALASVAAPPPAAAQVTCEGEAGPFINLTGQADDIVCINTLPRDGTTSPVNAAIGLSTTGDDNTIFLDSEGTLQTTNFVGDAFGIDAETAGARAGITILNRGDLDPIDADSSGFGIDAYTAGVESPILIVNSGDGDVTGVDETRGIRAAANEPGSDVTVINEGAFDVTSTVAEAYGIQAEAGEGDSLVTVVNSGDMTIAGGSGAAGIDAFSDGIGSPILIANEGDFEVSATDAFSYVVGIYARTNGPNSALDIFNTGDLVVSSDGADGSEVRGIEATTAGDDSAIEIRNDGEIRVTATGTDDRSRAIDAQTYGDRSDITIDNRGDLTVIGGTYDNNGYAPFGIKATTGYNSGGFDSDIRVRNSAKIDVTSRYYVSARGIELETYGDQSSIGAWNSGDIEVTTEDGGSGRAIDAYTYGNESAIDIENSGDLTVTTKGGGSVRGIDADSYGEGSEITVRNTGGIRVTSEEGGSTRGIDTFTYDDDSDIDIENSGDIRSTASTSVNYGYGSSARGIEADTEGEESTVRIKNSGDLRVTAGDAAAGYGGGSARGIDAYTDGEGSFVRIENSGDIAVRGGDSDDYGDGYGSARAIEADTYGPFSPIRISNSGDLEAIAGDEGYARGIDAYTEGDSSSIEIHNSGDFKVETSGDEAQADGIEADTDGDDSAITVHNSGNGWVETRGDYFATADGIDTSTDGDRSAIEIVNHGDFDVKARGDYSDADGIDADTNGDNSKIAISNSGDLKVETRGDDASADGIDAYSEGENSDIEVRNSGDITATASGRYSGADGIEAETYDIDSDVTIHNSGDLTVEAKGYSASADGIDGDTDGDNSRLKIVNSGDLRVTTRSDNSADGIDASTDGDNSGIEIDNSGDMTIEAFDGSGNQTAGIEADSDGMNSAVKVVNSGNLDVTTRGDDARAEGIGVDTEGTSSEIEIANSGALHAEAKGDSEAFGIRADSYGEGSPITIENSGSVFAKGGTRNVGIQAYSRYANKTTITNTGTIGAESHRAIDVKGAGTARIDNAGTVTGFVDLTDQDDVFNNQSGGVFETKLTSFFGAGDDLFTNRSGGTVLAATDPTKSETSSFVHLETFKNAGLISMQDGKEGDSFIISNTPGGTDLDYKGGGTLGVDSFLGGPGSKSDIFTIEGNVSGKTKVAVYNTNPGGGAFNAEGIPVVFATGETPDANAFRLQDGPIDAGFFDYDLFFEGGGSGQWELRSFAGGGAHLLPQLLTAAQDIWHQSSSTWFDRTADLRVLMHGGPAPADLGGKSLAAPVQDQLSPAVWLKGGGSWLDRDATASTSAYGRNYKFNLDRELETIDLQVGLDMGTRDVLGAGDALVFGVLGGFVYGDLDYDGLARRFQYEGGQVGVYATYLSGGLFVDTLLNAHITELDTNTRGFPGSVDANTVGLRTDAGYRFGSFSGGAFIEPLGTIEVMWADIDGFSQDGNRVSFDDDANVRGRLGLRAGTTSEVWEGTLMEPFIIGSLWSHLSGDNQANLVSSGRTFQFQDNLEDVWGEVSAGVNFFNFSQTTSVFGKVDVTFGDDVSGVGGKAGMRVAW